MCGSVSCDVCKICVVLSAVVCVKGGCIQLFFCVVTVCSTVVTVIVTVYSQCI